MAQTALTSQELLLLTMEDDSEEAPWMVMADPQITAVTNVLVTLRAYAHRNSLPWYVASMLPIRFRLPHSSAKATLAPDLFVAFVEERPRQSFDVEEEGGFPPFVVEVLSEASVERDLDVKVQAYEAMGAREYVLFAPTQQLRQPPLQGMHRVGEGGSFAPWSTDSSGRLYSDVLGLWLVPEGPQLRLEDAVGARLPMYEELSSANQELSSANGELSGEIKNLSGKHRSVLATNRDLTERNEQLEAEVARLRAELARRNPA